MDNNHMPKPEAVNVRDLLPQQPPFVMVDCLLGFDNDTTTCGYTVPKDGIFTNDGCLSAEGLVENIAQTCAARQGFYNKYVLKRGVQLGFIGAIRNFRVMRLPRVGQQLKTTIRVEENVMGMTLASAIVECEGQTMATTEIKIALIENVVKE
ncbi:pseudouridylate synthase [Hoylesella shahii]|uniref:pseudouridylate synthase n=1 Tax=Hoylesella shahii TaxID=228603 RepID=UPI0028E95768|nr:pseudouridylate synthase [Hoylesella shahii]